MRAKFTDLSTAGETVLPTGIDPFKSFNSGGECKVHRDPLLHLVTQKTQLRPKLALLYIQIGALL